MNIIQVLQQNISNSKAVNKTISAVAWNLHQEPPLLYLQKGRTPIAMRNMNKPIAFQVKFLLIFLQDTTKHVLLTKIRRFPVNIPWLKH